MPQDDARAHAYLTATGLALRRFFNDSDQLASSPRNAKAPKVVIAIALGSITLAELGLLPSWSVFGISF